MEVTVQSWTDLTTSPTRSFAVKPNGAVNAGITTASASVTIVDDDSAPVISVPTIEAGPRAIRER